MPPEEPDRVARPPRGGRFPRDQNMPASTDLAAVLADAGVPTNEPQLELLAAFRDRYAGKGLLPDGENVALWRCCPDAGSCWKDDPAHEHRRQTRGAITLPWIGPDYHRHRIVVLALNLREAGGLIDELQIVGDVLEALRNGDEKPHGSYFGYRSAVMVWAVQRALAGEPVPLQLPAPEAVRGALLECARLQLVKCSPFNHPRGLPFGPMYGNCAQRYLLDDLALLRPRLILAVHRQARGKLWDRRTGPWADYGGASSGGIEIDGRLVPIVAADHPTYAPWLTRSWPALRDHLNSGQLRQTIDR